MLNEGETTALAATRPRERLAGANMWVAQVGSGQAAKAIAAARDVATRVRERKRVESAVQAAERQTGFPKSIHWRPATVAQGFAGLALVHGHLDACFPGEGWDRDAHRALQLATWDANVQTSAAPGLFSGLGGLAFVTNYLSRAGDRYRALSDALENVLLPATIGMARTMREAPSSDVSVGAFDVISGLSGIGAYLLCRCAAPGPATALQGVLEGLIALTLEDDGLPRWYTPAHLIMDDTMRRHYPNGHLNCGLAHGIPGVLGLLALADLSGINGDGLRDAIDRVAQWLANNRCDDAAGVNWPNAVPLEPIDPSNRGGRLRLGAAASAPFGPSRSGWCYGPPGVARALWLAGEALEDTRYRDLAVAAMAAVYRRPIPQRQIDSPTFCHGVAGLLQVTLRFAHDTRLALFTDAAQALTDQLLSLYAPETALGYYNLEPGGRRVDQPGLLDGAPGVALVLLAAATGVEPSWDRLFMLS
jgi:lantibiotic biosynthesis protein